VKKETRHKQTKCKKKDYTTTAANTAATTTNNNNIISQRRFPNYIWVLKYFSSAAESI
jgi:hypothetical protein